MGENYISDPEAHAAGLKVLRDLGWPADSGFADMDEKFWAFTVETLFGRIWARPGLSLRERAIVTLSVLLAVDADRGSMNHIRFAHNVGITEEEMREIIIQVGFYSGWPKGAHAMARFWRIMQEPGNGFTGGPAGGKGGAKAGGSAAVQKGAKAGGSAAVQKAAAKKAPSAKKATAKKPAAKKPAASAATPADGGAS